MKKLRMIVTFVIVLAIVSSAFAFKARKGTFCVTTNLSSTSCTTYAQNFHIVPTPFGFQFKYFPAWDGDGTACTAAANTLCTASFRLDVD